MLDHHLQKQILKDLVIRDGARFAELKPAHVDGNIFTYHLQQLVKMHYVEKTDEGRYQLTASGKRLGISSDLSAQQMLERNLFISSTRRR
jgi:ribosomal protein S19E (S16A)